MNRFLSKEICMCGFLVFSPIVSFYGFTASFEGTDATHVSRKAIVFYNF